MLAPEKLECVFEILCLYKHRSKWNTLRWMYSLLWLFFLEEFLVFTIRAYLLSYYNQALLCLFFELTWDPKGLSHCLRVVKVAKASHSSSQLDSLSIYYHSHPCEIFLLSVALSVFIPFKSSQNTSAFILLVSGMSTQTDNSVESI